MFRPKAKAPLLPAEWLLVGLGNPGGEYRATRHNVGFMAIDALAEKSRIKLGSGRHRALTGAGLVCERSVVLAKPLTYMNASGQSVAPLSRSLGLAPDHILVISDDVDLPLGKIRLRDSGGHGGHNGHRSIQDSLGTSAYPRLRIGVGRGAVTSDHVLGTFTEEEWADVKTAVRAAIEICEALLGGGWQAALHAAEKANQG